MGRKNNVWERNEKRSGRQWENQEDKGRRQQWNSGLTRTEVGKKVKEQEKLRETLQDRKGKIKFPQAS